MTAPTVDGKREWVGGANVASRIGRTNASWPFGVLSLAEGRLTVRLRGFGWLAGRLEDCTPDEIDLAFPVGLRRPSGVGVRRSDGKEFYFWTRAGDEVLLSCAEQDSAPAKSCGARQG